MSGRMKKMSDTAAFVLAYAVALAVAGVCIWSVAFLIAMV